MNLVKMVSDRCPDNTPAESQAVVIKHLAGLVNGTMGDQILANVAVYYGQAYVNGLRKLAAELVA